MEESAQALESEGLRSRLGPGKGDLQSPHVPLGRRADGSALAMRTSELL